MRDRRDRSGDLRTFALLRAKRVPGDEPLDDPGYCFAEKVAVAITGTPMTA